MNIQIIDRLLSIPGNQEESTIKLKRVEGFWEAHLRTVGENGFYKTCFVLDFGITFSIILFK